MILTNSTTRRCYADEAGDGTIFKAGGHVVIGSEEEDGICFPMIDCPGDRIKC